MKKLLLIRHAKAVHDIGFTDFERPLKQSGIADAILMAERVKGKSLTPELLVTSPSLRTLTTANLFSEQLSLPHQTEDINIYEASLKTLLHIINHFPEDKGFIALVGHNPGISELIHYYTDNLLDVSPGSIALITFEVDEWQHISRSLGTLAWFSSPKNH